MPYAAAEVVGGVGRPLTGRSFAVQRRRAWLLFFLRAAAAKEAAQLVPDKALSGKLVKQADDAIIAAMDDYCGTGKSSSPRPHPGPPPGLNSLVGQIIVMANVLPAGALRTELGSIAGQLLKKGLAV